MPYISYSNHNTYVFDIIQENAIIDIQYIHILIKRHNVNAFSALK